MNLLSLDCISCVYMWYVLQLDSSRDESLIACNVNNVCVYVGDFVARRFINNQTTSVILFSIKKVK